MVHSVMDYGTLTQKPLIEINPTFLEFGTLDLGKENLPVGQLSLRVKNIGSSVLAGQINPQFAWVGVTPSSFQLPAGQSEEFIITLTSDVSRSGRWRNVTKDNIIFITSNSGALSVGGSYLIPPSPSTETPSPAWHLIISLAIVLFLFTLMLVGGIMAMGRRNSTAPQYVDQLYTQGAETVIAQLTRIFVGEAIQSTPENAAITQNGATPVGAEKPDEASEASPTPSITYTPWSRADYPNPEQFVIDYYIDINNRNYEATWNNLSPSFQKNCCSIAGNNPFLVYVNWWDSVEQVEVLSAYIQDWNANPAVIHARVVYQYRNGGRDEIIHIIEVILDEGSQTLKIDQVW